MFEYWEDDFASSLRRVVDPPVPVFVDLNLALAPNGAFRRDGVPMRVKVGALDLTRTVPGLLYAWAKCTDNSWIALVGFAIPTGNGKGRIETRQWTSARALSPRDPASRLPNSAVRPPGRRWP